MVSNIFASLKHCLQCDINLIDKMQLTSCMIKHCHKSKWYLQLSTRRSTRWINSTLTECIQPQAVRCFSNAKRIDSGGLAPGQCRPCRVYQSAFGKRLVDTRTLVEKVSDKADIAPINNLFLCCFYSFQLFKTKYMHIDILLSYCWITSASIFWVPGGETLCVKPWWFFFGFSQLTTRKNLGRTKKREGVCRNKLKKTNTGKKQVNQVFHAFLFMIFLKLFLPPPLELVHFDVMGQGLFFLALVGSFLQTWTHPSRRTKSEAPKIGHMVYMEATSVSSSSLCVFFSTEGETRKRSWHDSELIFGICQVDYMMWIVELHLRVSVVSPMGPWSFFWGLLTLPSVVVVQWWWDLLEEISNEKWEELGKFTFCPWFCSESSLLPPGVLPTSLRDHSLWTVPWPRRRDQGLQTCWAGTFSYLQGSLETQVTRVTRVDGSRAHESRFWQRERWKP